MKDKLANHRVTRRGFTTAAAGGTLMAGFGAGIGTWTPPVEAAERSFQGFPRLDGTVSLDETTRGAYAQDSGQIVHERPAAVVRPGSVEDVVRVVRFARRRGMKIAARGHAHQPFGQAQVEDGIVVDMQSLRSVHSVSADRVVVDAGADWRTVVHAAMRRGGTPPVLPNYLGLTVGGTLSIGGIGVASIRHGAQVDQVLELQVVTGEGDVVQCSGRSHRDLFEAALAGQGQCAIITRAALRLLPAKLMVREYMLGYADPSALLEDAFRITQRGRFDGAVAVIVPSPGGFSFALSAIHEFTPPGAPDDAALLEGLRPTEGSPKTRDISYLQYVDAMASAPPLRSNAPIGLFVPGSAAARFVSETLPRLTAADLGAAGGLRVFALNRASFTRPLLRLPGEESLVYMALLRTDTTDPSMVSRMLAGNRALYDQNRVRGGTLYPFAAVELSCGDWRRHYGEAGRALGIAKRRYDPADVFASGPDSLASGASVDGTD